MDQRVNGSIQKDAGVIETYSSDEAGHSKTLTPKLNISRAQIVDNSAHLTQNNSSSIMTFENCTGGIHFGNNIQIGSPSVSNALNGLCRIVSKQKVSPELMIESKVYRKTPTIKEMLESQSPLSPPFLDIVSGKFGTEWKKVMILLEICPLFVGRMYEDNFMKGGIKEVVYQILSNYFSQHPDKATVGVLITFLWCNGFRETVWAVKEFYKDLKKLESFDD